MIMSNIHAAKTNLSKLIEQALAGEEVVIARAGKPLVRLVPVAEAITLAAPADRPKYGAWMGTYKGKIWCAPDFDAPDPEFERLFYGEHAPVAAPGVAEE